MFKLPRGAAIIYIYISREVANYFSFRKERLLGPSILNFTKNPDQHYQGEKK